MENVKDPILAAAELLFMGITKISLWDEIYVQIMKQLTGTPLFTRKED